MALSEENFKLFFKATGILENDTKPQEKKKRTYGLHGCKIWTCSKITMFSRNPSFVSYPLYHLPLHLRIWNLCLASQPVVKNPPSNAGDSDSIPGSGGTPGEGNGNPLQDSCWDNPTNRKAWQATVHEITKSQTWLSRHARRGCPLQCSLWWETIGSTPIPIDIEWANEVHIHSLHVC